MRGGCVSCERNAEVAYRRWRPALAAALAGAIFACVGLEAQADSEIPRIANAAALAPFYEALAKSQKGHTSGTVTVLHLGDSHIASDRMTGDVRRLLQARFGDAGRGLMMPGFPFAYYKAPGFTFAKKGDWTPLDSLTDNGLYGVTGVSVSASKPDASLSLTSNDGPFASAEVWLLASPGQGSALLSNGRQSKEVATASDRVRVLRVALPGRATSLSVRPKGDGPITVLGWSVTGKSRGLRYVNLGIPGASALTTERWNRSLVIDDIRHLAPKLIILGYGTNEGFRDDLDLAAYQAHYAHLIETIKAAAPDAALLILGPFDGNRVPRFVKADDLSALPCRPLSNDERVHYGDLISRQDTSLARWYTPPELAPVRKALQRMAAKYHAAYLDLSQVMGPECSMDAWVHASPPLGLPDHVHLSDKGSHLMGKAIAETLLAAYEHGRDRASAMDGAVPPAAYAEIATLRGEHAR